MSRDRTLYECHVTIEPVFEARLAVAHRVAQSHSFKVANLLLQKRTEDTPDRSKHDTFMTGHSTDFILLQNRMKALIRDLKILEFKVWRYKIEEILVDSKQHDSLNLLS